MNAIANAAGFRPIVFGDPEYFKLRQVDRTGKDVTYQSRTPEAMADYLGLNGLGINNGQR